MNIRSIILNFSPVLRANIIKTLYVNFKMLPWRQAIRLPIFIYGRFVGRKLTGKIIFGSKPVPGMIRVGRHATSLSTSRPYTVWNIEGTVEFRGKMNFYFSSYILVAKNAHLTFGYCDGGYPSNCEDGFRVLCFDRIVFDDPHFAWDCQVMDTSFHYTEAIDGTSGPSSLTRPIHIGKHVWIGNRTTIMGGAIIPDETIIASHSLVNKDFSDLLPGSLIAGIPAKLKKTGIRRVWDRAREEELDKTFNYHRTRL